MDAVDVDFGEDEEADGYSAEGALFWPGKSSILEGVAAAAQAFAEATPNDVAKVDGGG